MSRPSVTTVHAPADRVASTQRLAVVRSYAAALLWLAGCSGGGELNAVGDAFGDREATTPPILHKVSTERVGALGTRDARQAAGIYGTDLGVSFVASGTLHFLFGDTWSSDATRRDRDSVAWLDSEFDPRRPGPPDLSWYVAPDGHFSPLRVAIQGGELDLGTYNVPVEGLEIDATQYLFFVSEFNARSGRHRLAALAHTRRTLAFDDLVLDHAVASDRFMNVSTVMEGETVFIFGSGEYRRSSVFLARVDKDLLPYRQHWEYLAEHAPPRYVAGDERAAVPLIETFCVGELSVRFHPALRLYLMAYNCIANGEQRGVHLRMARAAEGPWSAPLIIFDPDADRGYGHFIHRPRCDDRHLTHHCARADDGLADRGREREWGGEYAPYLVPQWSTMDETSGTHTIYYALSSWNPYDVHLMKTVLSPLPQPDRARTAAMVRTMRAASGAVSFTVPETAVEVRFALRASHGEPCARLVIDRTGEVVRESHTGDGETALHVQWSMDSLRNREVTIHANGKFAGDSIELLELATQ